MKIVEHARFGKIGNYVFNITKVLNHDELISGLVHKNITMDYIKKQYVISGNCFNHLIIPAHYHYTMAFDEFRFDSYLCRTEKDSEPRSLEYFNEIENSFYKNFDYFFSPEAIDSVYGKKESGYGYRSLYFFLDMLFSAICDDNGFAEKAHDVVKKVSDRNQDLFMVRPRKKVANSSPKRYEEIDTPQFLIKKKVICDIWAALENELPHFSFHDIGEVNPDLFSKTRITDAFSYVPATSYLICRNLFKENSDEFLKQVKLAVLNYKNLDPKTRFAFVSALSMIGAVNEELSEIFRRDRSTLIQEHFLKMICINRHLYPDANALIQPYLRFKSTYLSEHMRMILAYYGPFEWLPFLLGTNRKSTSLIVDERMERGF